MDSISIANGVKTSGRLAFEQGFSSIDQRVSFVIVEVVVIVPAALWGLREVGGRHSHLFSAETAFEQHRLNKRARDWRLACQSLVESSFLLLSRHQVRLLDREALLAAATRADLPVGPTSWPVSAQPLPDNAATPDDED